MAEDIFHRRVFDVHGERWKFDVFQRFSKDPAEDLEIDKTTRERERGEG